LLGELANLTVNEAETDMGTRTGDSATDEPARWRPKIALKRYTSPAVIVVTFEVSTPLILGAMLTVF
jgi:hypothetical protein